MEFSLANELLYFGEDGRLYIQHECEMCEKFPLEDLNDTCVDCGYSQAELLELRRNVDNINEAYDFFNVYSKEPKTDVKSGYLNVSSVKLGSGFDQIILSDFEETGAIRDMSSLVDKHCLIVVYYNEDDDDDIDEDWFFGADD